MRYNTTAPYESTHMIRYPKLRSGLDVIPTVVKLREMRLPQPAPARKRSRTNTVLSWTPIQKRLLRATRISEAPMTLRQLKRCAKKVINNVVAVIPHTSIDAA